MSGKCPECGLDFDAASLRAFERKLRRRRLLIAALVMFAVYYLPYAWLVLLDYPWSDYRWHWIKMWPALPLLLPSSLAMNSFFRVDVDEAPAIWILGGICLALLMGLIWFASRRARWMFLLIVAIVLGLSLLNSWILYHGFLM